MSASYDEFRAWWAANCNRVVYLQPELLAQAAWKAARGEAPPPRDLPEGQSYSVPERQSDNT